MTMHQTLLLRHCAAKYTDVVFCMGAPSVLPLVAAVTIPQQQQPLSLVASIAVFVTTLDDCHLYQVTEAVIAML